MFRNAAFSLANEIDGKFSDTLRNFLFGTVLEDLFSRNVFRGRDMQVPQYDELAACFGTPEVAGVRFRPRPFPLGSFPPATPCCAMYDLISWR